MDSYFICNFYVDSLQLDLPLVPENINILFVPKSIKYTQKLCALVLLQVVGLLRVYFWVIEISRMNTGTDAGKSLGLFYQRSVPPLSSFAPYPFQYANVF